MFPAVVIVLFLAIAAGVYGLTATQTTRAEGMQEQSALVDQAKIAEGIEQYMAMKGYPPASLDALVQEDGFEHLRSARNRWQKYANGNGLNDGVWQFERAASWTTFRKDGGASYPTENACGTGSVATAASWCGAADGVWFRRETREDYNTAIASQRVRQMRTLQLFADHWTARQSFPSTGNDGAGLGAGQQRSLAQLAGFTGAATTCAGVFVWQGIPLDCGALFDHWGSPVIYQFQSTTSIVLTTETPFRAANGIQVVIATPLSVQE